MDFGLIITVLIILFVAAGFFAELWQSLKETD